MIVAGEAFDEQLSRQWGGRYNFYNAYGPTETTVCAAISSTITTQHINIGKSIANTQLYVLDNNRQLLPAGSVGELYIGGTGLARGYLNQPKLTAERFVKHTFCDNTTVRLYRTGDLVRYLYDDNLAFIGRVDQQVKIRGFRIELGEIEQHITAHPDVNSSIVVVAEEEQRLIAYFTSDSVIGKPELLKNIRLELKNHLPAYMIPATFMKLEKFPLTPNGKIDRKALPEPDVIGSDFEYLAPEGEIEQDLAKIWAELLKTPEENISADANFFELGGHSLQAIKLLTKIRNTFDVNLKIESLFDSKTLSMLAVHINMLSTDDNDNTQEQQQHDMEYFEI